MQTIKRWIAQCVVHLAIYFNDRPALDCWVGRQVAADMIAKGASLGAAVRHGISRGLAMLDGDQRHGR